jgi:hypothetical protein
LNRDFAWPSFGASRSSRGCQRSVLDAAMVYIHSWQDYQEAAEALYTKSPNDVSFTSFAKFIHVKNLRFQIDTILCKMEIIRRETRPEDHR